MSRFTFLFVFRFTQRTEHFSYFLAFFFLFLFLFFSLSFCQNYFRISLDTKTWLASKYDNLTIRLLVKEFAGILFIVIRVTFEDYRSIEKTDVNDKHLCVYIQIGSCINIRDRILLVRLQKFDTVGIEGRSWQKMLLHCKIKIRTCSSAASVL